MGTGETCVMGARHESEIAALQAQQERLHEVDEQQWTHINQIRCRLPTWATITISLLTFLIGVLAAWAKSRGG